MSAVGRNLSIKRAYEPPEAGDGLRILVDRLWPRGLSKAKARIDRWMKQIAPSSALRAWFGHDPDRWAEFRRLYRAELAERADMVDELRRLARQSRITLIFSARDALHNDAVVLKEVLLEHAGRGSINHGKRTLPAHNRRPRAAAP